ncbi:glycosyltransferase [Cellulosimicrobium sp. PMB13]|uniref:glycosyltransferase n=1 Tax=Cellulosimicrobium sp. PMB13 TaxID=3120158 RepID=UPI003F4C8BB2
MATPAPRVSVVIPARDAAATLGEQLAAVCPQVADADGEVVVADNGSRDATREVATATGRRWPMVRLVDARSGRGPGGARNVGVAAARAPVVAFCDADDVVAEGWLDALVGRVAADRLVAGRLDRTRLDGGQSWQQQQDGLMRNPIMPGLWCAGAGNLAVRRDLFLAVGGFCEDLWAGEDVDLCWRAQLAGVEMVLAPDAVVYVRSRSALRGVYRQMYGWGTGSRVLERRYARLRAEGLGETLADEELEVPAHEGESGPSERMPDTVRKAVGAGSTAARRALRLLSARGRADAASALGERRGRARGTFGAEVPVLSPDDVADLRERLRHSREAGASGSSQS